MDALLLAATAAGFYTRREPIAGVGRVLEGVRWPRPPHSRQRIPGRREGTRHPMSLAAPGMRPPGI